MKGILCPRDTNLITISLKKTNELDPRIHREIKRQAKIKHANFCQVQGLKNTDFRFFVLEIKSVKMHKLCFLHLTISDWRQDNRSIAKLN